MSDSLVWQCIKDFNSFQRKRGCTSFRKGTITLSAEPGNLTSTNSFSASGLANSRSIAITASSAVVTKGKNKDKKVVQIVMSLKNAKKANKPAQGNTATRVRYTKYLKAENCIASQTADNFYRADLVKAATKKWSMLHQFRRANEGKSKGLVQKTGRKVGGK